MRWLRLALQVVVAGATVFAASAALVFELDAGRAPGPQLGALALLAAWAGASSLLQTRAALALAVTGLVAVKVMGPAYAASSLVLHGVLPLATCLLAIVLWRRWTDAGEGAALEAPLGNLSRK